MNDAPTILLVLALTGLPASAMDATPLSEDPVLELRVQRMATDLRCLVCQNESIAGSHADLAVDLRRQIREQARAGRSDEEIVEFLVDRYGDFILYRPPFKPSTWVLWVGPFALLAFAAALLLRAVVRRRRGAPAPLSEAEVHEALEGLGVKEQRP